MKKAWLTSLALLIPLFLHSQVCVTLYQGDDFGLEDMYFGFEFLETDPDGNIWFGLDLGSGILINYHSPVGKFNGSTWNEAHYSLLPSVHVSDIAFDRTDSAWIATGMGLAVVHTSTLEGRMIKTTDGLPEANVTAVAVDSSNVKWIGFNSGKVASLQGTAFTTYNKEWTNSPVNDIAVAADSSVWVGLSNAPGAVVYKNGTWTQHSDISSVVAVEADQWGRVMLASGDSMVIVNGPLVRVVHAAPGNNLRDLAVGKSGGIWASSAGGLLIRSGSLFVPFSSANSALPSTLADPIAFGPDNHLWFGYKYIISPQGYIAAGYLYRPEVQENAVIQADKPSLVFCYGDSLTLTAEADKPSYIWPDGSNTDTYRLYDADTVPVAVEGDNHCFYYDTIRVNVQKVYDEEKVCAVSVDTSQRNIIIWEKTPDVGTASYNIYREMAVKDSFEFIGNVPVGRLSVFEDPDADPREQSVKYKISCVDTCQNESGKCFYHETLHLTVNQGAQPGEVNLIWNHYQGIEFPSYIIYRGNSPDNLDSIKTISSSFNSWTDTDIFDTVYYRIAIPLPEACAPTGEIKAGTGPYYHSLSNMDDNKKLFSTLGNRISTMELMAYPNPFSDITRIEFPNPEKSAYTLRVYDLGGKTVREIRDIAGEEVILRRGGLEPGYYVFELEGERTYRGKFIIR